jgi:hypothetical protein
MVAASCLCDDIGKKLILDRGHAILDGELPLFQPLHQQLIRRGLVLEQYDLVVELAVLRPELDEFFPKLSLVDALHWPAGQCPS